MAHYDRDWDNLGRNIQDVVDRAVNSRDFQKLNQTIRQVVTLAVDVGGEAVRKAVDSTSGTACTGYRSVRNLYGSTIGSCVVGIVKTVSGAPLSLFTFLGLLWSAVFGDPITNFPVAAGFLLLLAGTGAWLTYSGIRTLGMVKRFRIYRRTLGNKTHCSVEQLARSVGKSTKFVRADLWQMIRKGLFREGHLDKEETCLITSNETYQYYEHSRLQLEERQRQEKAKLQQSPASDPRVQEVLDRGSAFIAQIRKCNDDIPGQEISEKIDHIELVVRRIFDRAQSHPEIVPDLKKLMDYYLPMTVKLLNAYADMDAQPVQGETIQSSKREIEASLDTLSLAFEKLLDSIFMDTAMDVSSDISVLNTLLAQEGLTQDDFSGMK